MTRALARGEFSEAEKIIEEATDPEFLNDGALSATPLNMVLTGRSSYFHQSRNLKLAHLLMQKGANPNLRIPNHDMESASESPLELLLRYYLKLVEVFGLPGSGQCRTSYRPSSFEETELMDTVGINGEIGGLGPGQITGQARLLLLYCLDNGGDSNLPTTDAAKTIFHMAMVAPVLDTSLVRRMLELGANVNIADVHNTTPVMDVISLGDQARALASLALLSSQSLMLDSDNCSLQSALWRSVFQGHSSLSRHLIAAGAGQASSARVEAITRHGGCSRVSRHQTIRATVPSLLAPLLSDSPCTANLHARLPRRRTGQPAAMEFSSHAVSHVCRHAVAPLVDTGHLQPEQVAGLVAGLISQQTDHQCAGDSAVVEPAAVLPLMFGELSAGLRQLAVRTILKQILFNCSPRQADKKLDAACERQGFMLNQLLIKPSLTKIKDPEEPSPSMLSYEYEIELGREMELSFGQLGLGNVDSSTGNVMNSDNIDCVELAVSDIVISDNPPSEAAGSDSSCSEAEEAGGAGARGWEEYAHQTLSELMDTISIIDRELETIKTDCELDRLDRDLATWETELVANLERIQRHTAELGHLDMVEAARRRSEELIRELREQRQILDQADNMEAAASLASPPDTEAAPRLVPRSPRRWLDENWSIGSARVLAAAGDTEAGSQSRSGGSDEEDLDEDDIIEENLGVKLKKRRSRIQMVSSDDGSGSDGEDVVSDMNGRSVEEVVSNLCQLCLGVYKGPEHVCPHQPSVPLPVFSEPQSPVSISHTETLVRSLTVAASYSAGAEADSSTELHLSSSTPPSPRTDADSSEIRNRFEHRFRSPPLQPPDLSMWTRSEAGVTSTPRSTPSSPPLPRLQPPDLVSSSSSGSDTEEEEENSSYDSDTWGGTFSLRHTRRQAEQTEAPLVTEASVILRLTPRTLFALTDFIGIPHSLRPLFSIEAARLQLCLALFCHKSISCDRNCEGDESESDDSEEDWLATDTEEEEEEEEEDVYRSDYEVEAEVLEAPYLPNLAGDTEDTDEDNNDTSSESSMSNFSQRSWYGSMPQLLARGRQLSPLSTPPPLSVSGAGEAVSSSDGDTADSEAEERRQLRGSASWLEDREDLMRVRQFLETSPGPDFTHSTDSED